MQMMRGLFRGDRVGRKPVLIVSLVLLALSSLGCTQAASVPELVWLRLITGFGIGALMPASVALASDYLPDRLRAVAIMVVFTGAPLGGFLGKIIVAQLLPTYGWPIIFWIGGLLPLALIPVLLFWCPESPRVLLARGQLTDRAARLLRQLGIDLSTPRDEVDVIEGNSVAGLFRDGLAGTTVLIWILYFSNLLSMYMISYWMPTVLSLSGLTPADAVFVSSMQDAGPLLSIFLIVPLEVAQCAVVVRVGQAVVRAEGVRRLVDRAVDHQARVTTNLSKLKEPTGGAGARTAAVRRSGQRVRIRA